MSSDHPLPALLAQYLPSEKAPHWASALISAGYETSAKFLCLLARSASVWGSLFHTYLRDSVPRAALRGVGVGTLSAKERRMAPTRG